MGTFASASAQTRRPPRWPVFPSVINIKRTSLGPADFERHDAPVPDR